MVAGDGVVIANILFDLDGTLTDPKEGIIRCIQFALGRLGVTVPTMESLLWCIGPPLKASFSRLLESNDAQLLDEAVRLYRERFAPIGIFENTLYPGIDTALARISAMGYRVYLATSKPTVYATRILEYFKLIQFFHGVYGSELDGRFTDKSELVAHILADAGLEPQQTLIVGDRRFDVIGGRENGILTANVTYGYGTSDEIAVSQPDYVFHSPAEISAFCQGERKRA